MVQQSLCFVLLELKCPSEASEPKGVSVQTIHYVRRIIGTVGATYTCGTCLGARQFGEQAPSPDLRSYALAMNVKNKNIHDIGHSTSQHDNAYSTIMAYFLLIGRSPEALKMQLGMENGRKYGCCCHGNLTSQMTAVLPDRCHVLR